MKIISERMDIKNLIGREACASALSLVLMKPYQRKVVSHFKKTSDDETKLAFDLPIDQAMQQLTDKLENQSTPEIEQRMNRILSSIIQAGVKPESEPQDVIQENPEVYSELNPS